MALPLPRFPVLGVGIDAIEYDAAVERIMAAADARSPYAVSALAVHGVMTAARDQAQRRRLAGLDLVCPDGQPVRWALNWLHGVRLKSRVYGPELMARLCRESARRDLPIFLYGTTPAILSDLARNLCASCSGLVIGGTKPSRFRRLDESEVEGDVRDIRASGARLLFVGLGCPRQEVWAYEMRGRLDMPIVAVGAAFAFHAGHLATAPSWMQEAGLEWLFRLGCEPRRLWRRYLLLNPAFALGLIGQRLGRCGSDERDPGAVPELRYG